MKKLTYKQTEALVLDTFKSLSFSQGMYSRTLEQIMEAKKTMPEEYKEFIKSFSGCRDTLDVVMQFEC